MAEDVKRTPDEYRQRPAGATFWTVFLALGLAFELFGLTGRWPLTLTHTLRWIVGPYPGARWWFIGLPLAALALWCIPHVLVSWGPWGARSLAIAVAVALLVGLVGWLATH